MRCTYDLHTIAPHMLKAMGVVALDMSACNSGGKGGKDDSGGAGFIDARGRHVGKVGEFAYK